MSQLILHLLELLVSIKSFPSSACDNLNLLHAWCTWPKLALTSGQTSFRGWRLSGGRTWWHCMLMGGQPCDPQLFEVIKVHKIKLKQKTFAGEHSNFTKSHFSWAEASFSEPYPSESVNRLVSNCRAYEVVLWWVLDEWVCGYPCGHRSACACATRDRGVVGVAMSGKKAVLILPSFAALHMCVFVFVFVFVFVYLYLHLHICVTRDRGGGVALSGKKVRLLHSTSLAALRLFGSAGSFMWCSAQVPYVMVLGKIGKKAGIILRPLPHCVFWARPCPSYDCARELFEALNCDI